MKVHLGCDHRKFATIGYKMMKCFHFDYKYSNSKEGIKNSFQCVYFVVIYFAKICKNKLCS